MTDYLFNGTIPAFRNRPLPSMDKRYLELQAWLASKLHSNFTLTLLSGDASFRRYFRIAHNNQSFVAMDAPPSKEDLSSFIKIAEILEKHQVLTPRILERNLEHGFLLLSDLGDNLFLQTLTAGTVHHLYKLAFTTLHQIQSCSLEKQTLPLFNEEMILRELSLFVEWFLEKHLELRLSSSEKKIIEKTFSFLINAALEQPQVFVHRDYHSRNLLLLSNDQVGVLDFQDAVLGPITYDLISLTRDCYIAWPDQKVEQWIVDFQKEALERKKLKETSQELFLCWADWMGIQRHLKAIGIFSRLNYRDNKSMYLNDIPRTLNYVHTISKNHSQLNSFYHWLEDAVMSKQA
ncbi:MAG: hypothetical protein ACD_44C00029G0008 [uncultured bacterium]|nr:MAG: hypothetical protein ACD_44C00029G0008 [uncultured bacterium]